VKTEGSRQPGTAAPVALEGHPAARRPTVLLLGRTNLAESLVALLRSRGCDAVVCDRWQHEQNLRKAVAAARAQAVIVDVSTITGRPEDLISSLPLTTALLLIGPQKTGERLPGLARLVDTAPPDAPPEELCGRTMALLRARGTVRKLARRLRRLRTLGKRLRANYEQIDNELIMAGQFQRELLPKQLPELPGIRFATLFRPFSWVSGDIYDIFRVDEDHLAFYVADAVGHGLAAGLLTMFVKQAVVPKKIHSQGYSLLSPAQVLAELNESLAIRDLPDCQYITMCYGLLNFRTMQVRFARGGHPNPLLIKPDGTVEPISMPAGCIMGVFAEQKFDEATGRLQTGQKVLIYSDGLQEALAQKVPDPKNWYKPLSKLANLNIQDAIIEVQRIIDEATGSLHPKDDITVLGMEVLKMP